MRSKRKHEEFYSDNCIDLFPFLITKYAMFGTRKAAVRADSIIDLYYRRGYDFVTEEEQDTHAEEDKAS